MKWLSDSKKLRLAATFVKFAHKVGWTNNTDQEVETAITKLKEEAQNIEQKEKSNPDIKPK